jgi:glycosyltransferase involved in cell wall biosynthesis
VSSSGGIGVALPTRDRPDSIVRLLESLQNSTVKVDQIAIVSYGSDLTEHLKEFEGRLNIIYSQSQIPGQVIQKKQAIELLSDNLEWCIFSDDDLLFEPWAIEEALKALERFDDNAIKGIGFALPPTSRVSEQHRLVQRLATFFYLNGPKPGDILKSGHAIDYLNLEGDQFTSWLNGVSMWKMQEAKSYGKNNIASGYAAYEDVIFSYPISKKGKLIYAHKASVRFQNKELTNFDAAEIFRNASYFRLFLVQTNSDLSSPRFLWSQIGRTIYVSLKALKREPKDFPKYWITLFNVLVQCCFKERPFRLVSTLVERNSTSLPSIK